MAIIISKDRIEETIHHLHYAENSAKHRLIDMIIQSHPGEEIATSENSELINDDYFIRKLWHINSPKEIAQKRKNFNSLKSSVNSDFQRLYRSGKNPDGIIIGEENAFDISNEAKDTIFAKFATGSGKDRAISLEQLFDLLNVIEKAVQTAEAQSESSTESEEFLSRLDQTLTNVMEKYAKDAKESKEEIVQEEIIEDDAEEEEVDGEEVDEEEVDEEEIDGEEIDGEEIDGEEIDDEEIDDEEIDGEEVDGEEIDDEEADESTEEPEEDYAFLEEIIEDVDENEEEVDEEEYIEEEEIIEEDTLDDESETEEIDDESDLDEETEGEEGIEEEIEEIVEEVEEVIEEVEEEIEEIDDDSEEEIIDDDEELVEIIETGLPVDSLGFDSTDQYTDDGLLKDKLLLEEKLDGYLGTMERFYNQYLLIDEGKYTVGCDHPKRHEISTQKITMPEYFMGKFPVTNLLFSLFVNQTGYITTAERLGYGIVYTGRFIKKLNTKTGNTTVVLNSALSCKKVFGACWHRPLGIGSDLNQKRSHPVVQVSIEDAMAYAQWIKKKIPTEFEWESGARTQSGYIFPWGKEWEKNRCNIEATANADTTAVDQYRKWENDLGIVDTLGNVLEWTVSKMTVSKKPYFIAKGGSWISSTRPFLYQRFLYTRDYASNIIGFRCVATD